MPSVDQQLRAARQSLLDLTLRNRLLHYRPSPARTLRIVDEIAREVFDQIVLQEKAMSFRPRAEAAGAGAPDIPAGMTEEEAGTLWGAPLPEEAVEARHSDRALQTALDAASLQKRLFYIHQQARSVLEEQGYTVLYLAIGFLEWAEPGRPALALRAPLVLVPVDLVRTKVGAAFRMAWTGEDLQTNISLQAKLAEQGIRLPDFEPPEEKGGLDLYFQAVAKAIAPRPGWKILADLTLDFFSFTKFVMYKDLDPRAWPDGRSPADHPLLRAILAPEGPATPEGAGSGGFPEEAVDERLRPRDLRHVLDADPSQIAVIEDVKAGRSLVVEGPPGTGKSQTIANLVAELMAAGKSVLFVSEKMAALEVVKGRLDRAGLGEFCLELHSRKSNKREVLRELERTLSAAAPKAVSLEGEFDRLEALQAELNAYARALREPIGALGRTPYELFEMKERARRPFAAAGRPVPRIEIPRPETIGPEAWSSAVARLTALAQAIPRVAPVATHPWRGCAPEAVLPADEEEIGGLIGTCREAAGRMEAALDALAALTGIAPPPAPDALGRALAAARHVAAGEPVEAAVLLGGAWDAPGEAAPIVAQLETLRGRIAEAKAVFEAAALDRDVPALLAEFRERSAGLFRVFSGRWRALKREIAALYLDHRLRSLPAVTADLQRLADTVRLRRGLAALEPEGRARFGRLWTGETTDPARLRAFADWAAAFRKLLRDGALAPAAAERVEAGIDRAAVDQAIAAVAAASKEYVTQLDFLTYRVKVDFKTVFGTGPGQVPFAAWRERLDLWKAELAKLPRWAPFAARRAAALKTAGAPVVAAIDADVLGPEDVLPAFEANVADDLLRQAFAQRPALAQFVGELHERKVEDFAALDRDLIGKNRGRLAGELARRRPRPPAGASPGSEAGILLGEFNRKRGHMPIRRLMAMAGGLIQKIKPCFMMSPLSIAQFLDPRTARFDVVIFDEASQVRPEDALGALLRGDQAVIMGDTRQLPPTRFFDHLVESEGAVAEGGEESAEADVGDVESILHQCRRAFPVKTLRWHYRSRHESLIAVSNREFYDSRLLVYPSAVDRADDLGLQLVHLPGAVYDRGAGSVNRAEARVVAAAAVEHVRRSPTVSLGIGAFNIRQQQAILEELELQLRAHPDAEPFFRPGRDEPVFVKNLETIQGDERDVIFLSLGFGFDGAGKLSLNFGPLNQAGGERRLNVLITRARRRCVVFSNFRAADLVLPPDAPAGLRALRAFLHYAETRELPRPEGERDTPPSPVEDAVAALLAGRGLEIRRRVGCAGFRVDLGAVDPAAPGRYAFGVLLDGPSYHGSTVARDRDRLRRQILEHLGWRLLRVWSTDWYRDRAEAEKTLRAAAERILRAGPLAPSVGDAAAPPPLPPKASRPPAGPGPAARPPSARPAPAPVAPVAYVPCADLGIPVTGDLPDQPTALLVHALQTVVQAEGPVHVEEAFRRVRELWGVKRAGERIQEALAAALATAEQRLAVRRRGDFLWPAKDRPVIVRTRSENPSIGLICEEEIAAALAMVLRQQFATRPEELVTRASRLLGFPVTSGGVAERIRTVLEDRLAVGALEMLPSGMVDLPKG